MFTSFFYTLRERKVPITITEWMTLMEALAKGYISSMEELYFLARAILIKSEGYFDHYDVAFQEYFQGIESPAEIMDEVYKWLNDPLNQLNLTEEEKAAFTQFDFDNLLKELEKRIEEQTEQHDGGGYWIGRGGYSPFGHSGQHPAGIRIGGESRNRSAVQIAAERKFKNYRNDLTLDVRQTKVALSGLRRLTREGPEDELDLDESIDRTAKNFGELELIWRKRRKNTVKVLLLMDVGGSMDPYSQLCSQLFSAAHSINHFKDFQYYYFHNCIYDYLYKDMEREETISTEELLQTLGPEYKTVVVGDARMGQWELSERFGAINYYERNELPGILWLKRVFDRFTHSVWLNPEIEKFWIHPTVEAIGKVFPMYPLTVDGLGQAVRKLTVKK